MSSDERCTTCSHASQVAQGQVLQTMPLLASTSAPEVSQMFRIAWPPFPITWATKSPVGKGSHSRQDAVPQYSIALMSPHLFLLDVALCVIGEHPGIKHSQGTLAIATEPLLGGHSHEMESELRSE
eukprot:5579485-Amphidinium_carterae.1